MCPCPVWLIGRRLPARMPWRIVAAINPTHESPTEQQLNETVLEWALTLKDIAGADLTLLHAWTAFGASVLRSRLPQHEFVEYIENAGRAAQAGVEAFAEPHLDRLHGVAVQLIHGEPHRAICDFVDSNAIDLVVMGTVARSGIPGLVMGNTAERVLKELSGSVLAIKPPGFVSPIAPI